MARSIRWRLIVSYVLLTVLAVSVVGVLAVSLVQQHVERQEHDYLHTNVEAIAQQAQALLPGDWNQPQLISLARTTSFLGNVRVRILDAQHNVLSDSGSPVGPNELAWIAPQSFIISSGSSSAGAITLLPLDPLIDPRPMLDRFPLLRELPPEMQVTIIQAEHDPWGNRLTFEIAPDQTPTNEAAPSADIVRSSAIVTAPIGSVASPIGYVVLSDAPNFNRETIATTGQALLLAGLAATVIAAIVGIGMGRGLTQPLRTLTLAANRMGAGELSARATVSGRDEFGQLAQQFNLMADRLEQNFATLAAERDALRRFVADASHELRTPITALKNFNELLQGAAARDSTARTEFLVESQTQINRLEWITRHLLDLSRLDAGLITLDRSTEDAGDLIEAAASPFKSIATAKAQTLSIERPAEPIALDCARTWVELALANLLDNAVKFTPPGGHIRLGARQSRNSVQLWVSDDGPGIDPIDQSHLFDRFFRGRAVGNQPGSGLGLSIVRSVAHVHGGRVDVATSAGGSTLTLELPLTPQT